MKNTYEQDFCSEFRNRLYKYIVEAKHDYQKWMEGIKKGGVQYNHWKRKLLQTKKDLEKIPHLSCESVLKNCSWNGLLTDKEKKEYELLLEKQRKNEERLKKQKAQKQKQHQLLQNAAQIAPILSADDLTDDSSSLSLHDFSQDDASQPDDIATILSGFSSDADDASSSSYENDQESDIQSILESFASEEEQKEEIRPDQDIQDILADFSDIEQHKRDQHTDGADTTVINDDYEEPDILQEIQGIDSELAEDINAYSGFIMGIVTGINPNKATQLANNISSTVNTFLSIVRDKNYSKEKLTVATKKLAQVVAEMAVFGRVKNFTDVLTRTLRRVAQLTGDKQLVNELPKDFYDLFNKYLPEATGQLHPGDALVQKHSSNPKNDLITPKI